MKRMFRVVLAASVALAAMTLNVQTTSHERPTISVQTASATPTQTMTTQAKVDFLNGVNLAASTYKLSLITNTSTAGASTTTWAGISANEVAASGSYAAGGATLAGRAVSGTCVTFTSPVSFTTATITARAAVIYNSTSGNVIGIYCLDGGSCAADTTSTNGTFTVNLPGGGPYCVN